MNNYPDSRANMGMLQEQGLMGLYRSNAFELIFGFFLLCYLFLPFVFLKFHFSSSVDSVLLF
jgi:hypothetical protein